MSIYSLKFVIVFAALLAVLLWISKRKEKAKISYRWVEIVLLVSSYCFMAAYDIRFLLILILYSIWIYIFALQIQGKEKYAKIYLGIGVVTSIGLLGVFKYLNFFLETLGQIFGKTDTHLWNIILPIGISFYVFAGISYLIDIYHKKYKAEKDLIEFCLYMSFFPKIIAGPIVRAGDFLEQLKEERTTDFKNIQMGVQLYAIGMFKKIVIADHLSVIVDQVFATPMAFSGATILWGGIISYTLQIYFDFSGYSDIAIGLAKCMGFDFKKNFNLPYISKNLSEFWKRWHISLSSWLQEYVYFSLGGNRRGTICTYMNLVLTMVIGGLWHGAAWTFVLWGGLHGIGLCVHKGYKKHFGKSEAGTVAGIISVLLTLIYVAGCWVFFRADTVGKALTILYRVIAWKSGINHFYSWTLFAIILLSIATFVAYKKSKTEVTINGFYPILNLNKFVSLILFFVFIGIIIIMSYTGNSFFIYGKF